MTTEQSNENQSSEAAIAVFYDGEQTPIVTAIGKDELAKEIVALAEVHQVPIFRNPMITETLLNLEIGSDIPEELYLSMAYVIAFALKISGNLDKVIDKKDLS